MFNINYNYSYGNASWVDTLATVEHSCEVIPKIKELLVSHYEKVISSPRVPVVIATNAVENMRRIKEDEIKITVVDGVVHFDGETSEGGDHYSVIDMEDE